MRALDLGVHSGLPGVCSLGLSSVCVTGTDERDGGRQERREEKRKKRGGEEKRGERRRGEENNKIKFLHVSS